ncbi:MAG: MFS transporter [Chloroflexi bacterium]|nr:MAG: MFS transporter [Chloroflexota bacterium]MBL1192922.1 MFS transporter [Chloroflexota bacterium]NOH10215.1 MFS transporter [Chloroflexota bacterium]
MTFKRIYPILLIVFTNLLGAGVILPVLPIYAVGQMGATAQQAALLGTAFFAAQFLSAPWLGRLSDQYGRRPVLLVSQLGTVLSFVLFIVAGPVGLWLDGLGINFGVTGGLVMLFVARILDGLTGGNITAARAYLSDVTGPEERASSMGYLSAAFGAGFTFGPVFGGLLGTYGPVVPFIGAAIITAGTFLLTFFTLDESHPPESRGVANAQETERLPLRQIFSNRPLFLVILTGFLGTVAFAAIPPTFALYVDQVVFADVVDRATIPRNIGLMFAFLGVATVLTQAVFYRPLVKWLRERKMIVFGQIIFMLSVLSIGFITNPILLTLMMAPFALGRGVTDPTLQALVTRFGDEKAQGQMLGLFQSVISLAMIFGPVWAGWIYQNIGPSETYIASGLLVSGGIFTSLLLLRERSLDVVPQAT